MRCFVAFVPIVLVACNGASPGGPPPHVDPPVVACTMPVDASACATSDADVDAFAEIPICDAGPAYPLDECALPPSVCADSHWAAYFDDGTCMNGKCELVTKYHYCETGCSNGACVFHGSTLAGRGF